MRVSEFVFAVMAGVVAILAGKYICREGLRYARTSREIGTRSAMCIFRENAISAKNGFEFVSRYGVKFCEATRVFFYQCGMYFVPAV